MRSVVLGIIAFIASVIIIFAMSYVEAQVPGSRLVHLPLTETLTPTNTPTATPAVSTVDERTASAVTEVNDFMSALIAKAFQMIRPSQQTAYANDSTPTGLAAEPPLVQTQTALDLKVLHDTFDSLIPQWENQLSNNQNASILPADAGPTLGNNTKEILYGKCENVFYLYVVESTKPTDGPADGEGYVYSTASTPGECHPPQWTVYDWEDVGGHWYFVTLQSVATP